MTHLFKWGITLFSFALLFSITGCSDDDAKSSDCEMMEFKFTGNNNDNLADGIVCDGVIDGSDITVEVPSGTDVSSLVANFTSTGAVVRIGTTLQVSGTTVNNFSSPLTYTVVAEDNTTKEYVVSVVKPDKAITSFIFEADKNAGISTDAEGVITGSGSNWTVTVSLPESLDRTALIPTFVTTGTMVTVNNAEQTSGTTAVNFTNDVVYTVTAENGTTARYTVKIQKLSAEISSFRFNKSSNSGLTEDVVFTIDQTSKTITGYIGKWIDSPNPGLLKPTFTVSTGAAVYVTNNEQTSGTTAQSFVDEITYTVKLSEDVKTDYTVKVVCPQLISEIPVMRFSVNLGTITSKEEYRDSKLEIIGNGITTGLWHYTDADMRIRLRGNSTMGLPKKPFRINFPDNISPLGLNHANVKNWVLLANDADKSLVRNAVAFAISRTLLDKTDPYHSPNAVLFTAATQHVNVYVGDAYQGVYHLTDHMQRATGRIDIPSTGMSGDALTGGYHVELDGFAYSEILWFETPKSLPVTIKYPDAIETVPDIQADVRYQYIKNYFADAENAIFAANYTDPVNGWRKYFDESTLVDYYIISEFTGNPDSWWSTHMYKLRDSDGGKLYFGPVWDFDIAFDNDSRINNAVNTLMLTGAHEPKTWMTKLFTDAALKAAVKARWNAKKADLLANAINVLTTDSEAMPKSIEANFTKWNIGEQALGHGKQRNYTKHENALNDVKTYINARYNYLDGVFNGW